MKCEYCQGMMERRNVLVPTRIGELTVENQSVVAEVCTECGAFELTATQSRKVSMQAVLVAFREAKSVTGAMVRSARKHLGFTQVEFAEVLQTTPESISRWERGEREIPHYLRDQVIRLALERLNPNVAPPSEIHLAS